ncbi:hypothetical protein MBLNU457_5958t1 [Dothideomycetes sp. NU457]
MSPPPPPPPPPPYSVNDPLGDWPFTHQLDSIVASRDDPRRPRRNAFECARDDHFNPSTRNAVPLAVRNAIAAATPDPFNPGRRNPASPAQSTPRGLPQRAPTAPHGQGPRLPATCGPAMVHRGQCEARLPAPARVSLLGARHVDAIDLALRVRLVPDSARTRAQLSGPIARSSIMRHLPRPAAVPLRPHRVVLRGALACREVVACLPEAQGGLWLWLFVGWVYGPWTDSV